MALRTVFRRKVVLPITILRRNGQEKILAHTLDLTENSARVGGLAASLDPGETIEVQRGGVKAKFQVFWMGAPSSAMAGQAGVRSLEPNKSIWGVNLPEDMTDLTADPASLRNPFPPAKNAGQFPGENRWHPRYQCKGSASVKQQGVPYPVHAEVKDVSLGGIYLEMSTPLLVGTAITVVVNILGVSFEAAGSVRTSYPLVGMGIAFTKFSSQNQEKIAKIIEKIQQQAPEQDEPDGYAEIATPEEPGNLLPGLSLGSYAIRDLTSACETLASNCDRWKPLALPSELQELRDALSMLQHKLTDNGGPEIELMDFYSAPATNRTQ